MREIKFRAWDNEHKCFNETVAANILMQLHEPSEDVDEEYGKRFFLDQFTGLKDKHGNTYCSNDIIKYAGKNYRLIQGNYSFELVGFWQGCQDNPSDFFSENAFFIGEIIGNIHENPELLNDN